MNYKYILIICNREIIASELAYYMNYVEITFTKTGLNI